MACANCGHDESQCTFEELVRRAKDLIKTKSVASEALLQRDLKISCTKSVEVLETLEKEELISPQVSDGSRIVYISKFRNEAEELRGMSLLVGAIELGKQDEGLLKIGKFQRRLRIGYQTAKSIMDTLEETGIVSTADEFNRRRLLINQEND